MEWSDPIYGRKVAYGLAQEEFSNIRIRNSNTYHRMKIKIHLVKITDDDVTSEMLFEKIFNKSASKQEVGMIPQVYQISDRPKPNKYINSVLTYKGCSVNMSPNFQTQARVVKTFSRTLNPGDTLDFRMTNYLGPGIRLDIARVFMLTSRKGLQPSGYFPIIEAEGTPCEGQDLRDGSIYQGSSPGWYNYEYTTGIKAFKHNSIVSSSSFSNEEESEDSLNASKISYEYAVKIYEREFLSRPPISYAADDIGEPGEKDKKFSVFTTSDERVVYSKSSYKRPTSNKPVLVADDFDQVNEDEIEEEIIFEEEND